MYGDEEEKSGFKTFISRCHKLIIWLKPFGLMWKLSSKISLGTTWLPTSHTLVKVYVIDCQYFTLLVVGRKNDTKEGHIARIFIVMIDYSP